MNFVPVIHGAVAMGCLVAAMFFLRFWRQSRDGLFIWFGNAFALLGVSYALLGVVALATEWRVYIFVLRLLAFCLILYGVLVKNRS